MCPHFDSESEFCQPATNHFYILLDSTSELNEAMQQIKTYAVPCLFTTFKHLFPTSTKLETNGDVLSKLKLAIEYKNQYANCDSTQTASNIPFDSSSGKKQFDKSNKLVKLQKIVGQETIHNVISLSAVKETHTEKLCSETLK